MIDKKIERTESIMDTQLWRQFKAIQNYGDILIDIMTERHYYRLYERRLDRQPSLKRMHFQV